MRYDLRVFCKYGEKVEFVFIALNVYGFITQQPIQKLNEEAKYKFRFCGMPNSPGREMKSVLIYIKVYTNGC